MENKSLLEQLVASLVLEARNKALEEAAKVARACGEAFRVRNPSFYGEGYADASDTIERAILALKRRTGENNE